MSEEFNTQQTQNQPVNAAPDGSQPEKKSGSKALDILATVVSFGVVFLFGILGGLICFGGYWLVKVIVKSKMPTAAKVILSVLVVLVFLALLAAFVLFSAAVQANV